MENQRKNKYKEQKQKNIQELWDSYKICNIYMRIEAEQKRNKEIFKVIIVENFPKLMASKKWQMECQRTQKIILKKSEIPCIIFKLDNQRQKLKEGSEK